MTLSRGPEKFSRWATRQLRPVFERAETENRGVFAVMVDFATGTVDVAAQTPLHLEALDGIFTDNVRSTLFEILRVKENGEDKREIVWGEHIDEENDIDEEDDAPESLDHAIHGLHGFSTDEVRAVAGDMVALIFGNRNARVKHWKTVEKGENDTTPQDWPERLPYLAPGRLNKRDAIWTILTLFPQLAEKRDQMIQRVMQRFSSKIEEIKRLAMLKILSILGEIWPLALKIIGMKVKCTKSINSWISFIALGADPFLDPLLLCAPDYPVVFKIQQVVGDQPAINALGIEVSRCYQEHEQNAAGMFFLIL